MSPMRRVMLVSLVLFAGLLLSDRANGQGLPLVQGRILDKSGAAVANQPVLIEKVSDPENIWGWSGWLLYYPKQNKWVSVTDSHGAFQVVDLPFGKYRLKLLPVNSAPVELALFTLERGYTNFDFGGKALEIKIDLEWKPDEWKSGEEWPQTPSAPSRPGDQYKPGR